MKFERYLVTASLLAILSLFSLSMGERSVIAEDNQPLKLSFVGAGVAGPPSTEVVNGTLIFKVTALESVTGDLQGTLTEKITQVYSLADEDELLPITTSWKLVTAAGTIEGYYSGLFQHMQTGDHMIMQHGEVLSVTGAYRNLYQANVRYQAVLLSDHMTISGTLVIQPNQRQ